MGIDGLFGKRDFVLTTAVMDGVEMLSDFNLEMLILKLSVLFFVFYNISFSIHWLRLYSACDFHGVFRTW